MATVTLEEAQAHLPDLLDRLQPGEVLVITREDRPVARLVAEEAPRPRPRKAGSATGQLIILDQGDGHLADFAEDMG